MSAACMNIGKLTLVSFPEPDPMEKQGLCITDLLNNCLKMQTCPGGYVCAAAEPLSWDTEFGVKIWLLHC